MARVKTDYWKRNKHLVERVNVAAILAQEEKDGVPVFKRGTKLIKELTRQQPRHYIPNPYQGSKLQQRAKDWRVS
jgi:hypothetical protein